MSALATEHNALNLSQGFPDFPCDPELFELTHKYMKSGKNQYAPMAGVPELRNAVSEKTNSVYGHAYNPETEITITAGATQAIYTAITASIEEGDEVILFTPAYDCYEPAILLNGGVPIFVQLKTPDYTIDWGELQRVVNRKTRMIIINTPHNPTGSLMSAHDMKMLEKITKGTNIIILSDEVYEHIVFNGEQHQSVCKYPGLRNRSFVVSSFGKTFHATGWKMGYCVAPESMMAEFRRTHQFIVFSVNTPAQYAMAEYLDNEDHYKNVASLYEKKRDLFVSLLEGSRFKFTPSKGTYFQLLNYSDITQDTDTDVARDWTKTNGIASVPISVFYHKTVDNNMLRFCFAKEDETLEKAAEILKSI